MLPNSLIPFGGVECRKYSIYSQNFITVPALSSSPSNLSRSDSGLGASPIHTPIDYFDAYDEFNFRPISPCKFELDLLSEELYRILKDRSVSFGLFQSPENLFSMFIDQERWGDSQWTKHEEGPVGRFDIKEPGYMKAMLQAGIELFKHEDDLTAEFIEHIHKLCVENVKDSASSTATLVGRYRKRSDNYEGFGLVWGESVSKEGIAELSVKVANYKVKVLANGRRIPDGMDIGDCLLGGYVKSLNDLKLTLSSEDFIECTPYVTKNDEFDQTKWGNDFPIFGNESSRLKAKVNLYITYLNMKDKPMYLLDRLDTSVAKYTVDLK